MKNLIELSDKFLNSKINSLFRFNKKLIIRNYVNLNTKEFKSILDLRNNPEIRKNMVNTKLISKKEHNKFIDSLKKKSLEKINYYWLIILDNKIIGSISLTNLDNSSSSCFSGAFVNPKFIGSGFGILIIYIQHYIAFELLNLIQIESNIEIANKKAIKINKFFGAFFFKKKKMGKRFFYPIFFKRKKWKLKIKNLNNSINSFF